MTNKSTISAAILALGLVGCATSNSYPADNAEAIAVTIAEDVLVQLPSAPQLEHPVEFTQTVISKYDGKSSVFRAHLVADNASADIVIFAVSGPRIIDINWTTHGIEEVRSPMAPQGLSGLNVITDIFLTKWPLSLVEKSLTGDSEITSSENKRVIKHNDRVIVSIDYNLTDETGRLYTSFTNHSRGYELSIYTD